MKTQLAVALAVAMTAGAAHAEPTTADFDVKCAMILSASSQNQANPQQGEALRNASFYYLGRLDSRTPAVDFEASSKRLAPSMGAPDAVKTQGEQCMQLIGRRIALLKKNTGAPTVPPARKPKQP